MEQSGDGPTRARAPPEGRAMIREALTPGRLYMLLTQEMRARRTSTCQCRMPLPFLIERPDLVSANWRIGTPSTCVNGCDALIAEIAAKFWPVYDLRDPMATPVKVETSRVVGRTP